MIGETWRNLRASRVRTAATFLVFAIAIGAAMLEVYASARAARAQEVARIAAGYTVVSLSAPSLPGADCERLKSIRGVVASGAAAPIGDAVVRPGDLSTLPAYRISPGFVRVMATSEQPTAGGVLVGQEAANQLGIPASVDASERVFSVDPAGSPLLDSLLPGIRRIELTPRGETFARALLIVDAATATYTNCYAMLAPPMTLLAPQILAAEVRAPDSVVGNWLVDRGQFSKSPAADYHSRPARWTWLAMGILVTAFVGLVNRARAIEFALYRANGATVRDVLALYIPELWFYGALAIAIWPVWPAAVHVFGSGAVDWAAAKAAVLDGLKCLCVSLLGSCCVTLLAMRGSPWELLRRE